MSIGCSADKVRELDFVNTLKSARREVTEVAEVPACGEGLLPGELLGLFASTARGLGRAVALVEDNSLVKPV